MSALNSSSFSYPHPLQKEIITVTGAKPTIDPQLEVEKRINFLINYLQATKAKGFVLGISGGVDSTIAGRICQLAVEKIRALGTEATFMAVRLPYHVQADEADAQAAIDFISPDRNVTFNIGDTVDAFETQYDKAVHGTLSDFTKGNTKARVRMMTQYALGGDHGLLVVGTDQAAENVTGFFTKFGDGGADVLPLAGLTKRQVRALVSYLGGSAAVSGKAPTADLLDGKPGRLDEEELGIPYDAIDDYLEGKAIDAQLAAKLEAIFIRTRHKRAIPVTPTDTWWR